VVIINCDGACFFVRKLKTNPFVVLLDERFCVPAVLLQVRNLKRELKFLFCFSPVAVGQQNQHQSQIPSLPAVNTGRFIMLSVISNIYNNKNCSQPQEN
jgi:hypothetical protein